MPYRKGKAKDLCVIAENMLDFVRCTIDSLQEAVEKQHIELESKGIYKVNHIPGNWKVEFGQCHFTVKPEKKVDISEDDEKMVWRWYQVKDPACLHQCNAKLVQNSLVKDLSCSSTVQSSLLECTLLAFFLNKGEASKQLV